MLFGMRFHPLRFSLAEAGTEGDAASGGGGGGSPAASLPPLPSVAARSRVDDVFAPENTDSGDKGKEATASSSSSSTVTPPGSGKAAAAAADPAASTDSGKDGKAATKPAGETAEPSGSKVDKRLSDTQDALRRESEARKKLEAENAEAKRKLALLEHPAVGIDWKKTEEFVKEHEEQALDQPVTRRELAEKAAADQKAKDEAAKAEADAKGQEEQQKFIQKFLEDNPHVVPYAKTGELYGVAMRMANENPDADLTALSVMVSDFYREREEKLKRTAVQEVNTMRTALSQGGTLPAGSSQPAGSEEDQGDDPAVYVAGRRQGRHLSLGMPRL